MNDRSKNKSIHRCNLKSEKLKGGSLNVSGLKLRIDTQKMSYCCTSSITSETKNDDFGIISIDWYCIDVAMEQLYKGDHFIQKSFKGEDKNKEVTTNVEAVTSLKIGYHILDNNSDGTEDFQVVAQSTEDALQIIHMHEIGQVEDIRMIGDIEAKTREATSSMQEKTEGKKLCQTKQHVSTRVLF